MRLSRQNTVLGATMRDDRSTAAELTRKARQTRQEINQDELKIIVAAAREANALIDGRTFSWTALFNQLESTLPPDVMLSSVRPTIDDNGTKITMVVLGRRTADLDEFMEKLEATGAFENVLPHQQNLNDEGLTQATIDGMYVPEVTPAAPPAASRAPAAPAKPPPAGQDDRVGCRRRAMRLVSRVLAEKRTLIYPLIGAVLVNAALFVAVVYPLSLKVANGERDAQAAASARKVAQAEYDAAQATVSGKKSADDELKKFYEAVLPPDMSAARRIALRQDRQAGVDGERQDRAAEPRRVAGAEEPARQADGHGGAHG